MAELMSAFAFAPRPRSGLRRFLRASLSPLALALALGLADAAAAREVTITARAIDRFVGGAYVIFYITDADRENYQATLWAAGDQPRFVSEARHWWRATGHLEDRHAEYDGRSGPSMARRDVLELSVEIADELFEAGFVLRVDSALWDGRTFGSDVVVPLTADANGKPFEGRGYVESVRLDW